MSIKLSKEDNFNELLNKFSNTRARFSRSTDDNKRLAMSLHEDALRQEILMMAGLSMETQLRDIAETLGGLWVVGPVTLQGKVKAFCCYETTDYNTKYCALTAADAVLVAYTAILGGDSE